MDGRTIGKIFAALFVAIACGRNFAARAQENIAPIRQTVSTLRDGSRQFTKVDPANHVAEISTYNLSDKLINRIVYQINDEGLWVSGVVYDGKKNVILQATYQYDSLNRLAEEKQFTKDGVFFCRLVYRYGPNGKLEGIDAFDANGNPIKNKPAAAVPVNSGKSKRK